MSENLIEQTIPSASVGGRTSGKPNGLPDKFWNVQTGVVDINALIADYNYMASRDENLVETHVRGIPASYDKYEINIPSPLLARDDEVLQKFFAKGFSNEQAQLVYDLANERVLPVINNLTADFEAQKQLEKLTSYFGGKEKFNEISRQISAWSKQNIRPEVYDALATTYEGVVTLYKMMSSKEPALGREAGASEEITETSLRKMMEDPRYWRDKDAGYAAKIQKGFEKLYPEKH